ncbi:carboxypeptidase-like regulatory domain-containing protein [Microbispora amethystogenes]|uniref:carboxypeptidase-like regulatory domain-containing protein n=1 Tax=Microbispora amethystogenes TaxID=1427754 RepID=UPI0033FEA206
MERRVALGVLLTAALSGCGIVEEGQVSGSVREERSGRGGEPGEVEPGEVEPGVLKGRVVDAQGRPIEGAEIVADNQLLYNSNAVARTAGDGLYRVDTDVRATFHASGTVVRRYNGQDYTLSLAPDDDAPFAGPSGAIRNFTWKLTGKKPDDLGFYGSKVLFRLDLNDQINTGAFLDDEKVRLTLTPEGPLIDGSEGTRIVRQATRNGDGSGLEDIPVGRYRIAADYEGRPLRVKLLDGGDYAEEVVAEFAPLMTGIYRIELELGLPQG